MNKTPETLEELFESATLQDDDIANVVDDDMEDELLGFLESTRKISIFDSEYVLEGEE